MLDVRPLDNQFRKLASRGRDGGTAHFYQPGHESSEKLPAETYWPKFEAYCRPLLAAEISFQSLRSP